MKLYTPEISWHACDAIYSIDFDPLCSSIDYKRFATCGVDQYIRIWVIGFVEAKDINVNFICELARHQKSVNIVRYSPNGTCLASGDDDGIIYIWQRHSEDTGNVKFKCLKDKLMETWTVLRTLRGHVQDICDLAWSPDNRLLFSCAQDKTCILWDTSKAKYIHLFNDHKNFAQGVSWDPLNKYLVSLGRDRVCRIYSFKTRQTKHKILKSRHPLLVNNEVKSATPDKQKLQSTHLFQDDNLKCFFRRLSFTPLGEFLLAPTGCIETEKDCKPVSYIFARSKLNTPVAYIPCKGKSSSAIKCCPILFKLKSIEDKLTDHTYNPTKHSKHLTDLPYRIIFAILEETSISIYDTQQLSPIITIEDIHYWWLSDLSWSPDGLMLIVTSTDGYCTIVSFEPFELGEPYHPPLTLEPYNKHNLLSQHTQFRDVPINNPNQEGSPKLLDPLKDHDLLLSKSMVPNVQSTPSLPSEPMDYDECQNVQDSNLSHNSPNLCIPQKATEEMVVDLNPQTTLSSAPALSTSELEPKPTPFNLKPTKLAVNSPKDIAPKRRIAPITLNK